mgnify:CR=1 FL=1
MSYYAAKNVHFKSEYKLHIFETIAIIHIYGHYLQQIKFGSFLHC